MTQVKQLICINHFFAGLLFFCTFVGRMTALLIIIVYFGSLYLFSQLTTRCATNESFFLGDRRSSWPMVAFGMVGASISGVTFVSVPGMVLFSDMTYLQMCLGFIVGYFLVALVLLPIYYKRKLTTIYSYLGERLGKGSQQTGSVLFLLSKLIGASMRFYLAAYIVQQICFDGLHIPFALTVVMMVALIWLYTRHGGVRTLVSTDVVQTIVMLLAVICLLGSIIHELHFSPTEAINAIANDSHSRIFVFDDWTSRQYFWKQFLSGIFIVVVMTGLDQDMMQKNLTCRTLRDAQKDMCTYGFAFAPVNMLFLGLGVLLVLLAQQQGTPIPTQADALLPQFVLSGQLGQVAITLLLIGILASSFSSADSAMTALTTSICVDLFHQSTNEKLRRRIHLVVALAFIILMLLFRIVGSGSIIDAIYTICGYTYGPLLGLFAFALFTHRGLRNRWVPLVCVLSPVLAHLIGTFAKECWDYSVGYELLLLNGLITFTGLLFITKKE